MTKRQPRGGAPRVARKRSINTRLTEEQYQRLVARADHLSGVTGFHITVSQMVASLVSQALAAIPKAP